MTNVPYQGRFLLESSLVDIDGDTPTVQGVLFIVPTFEAAFARVQAYAVFECHKGLYYHNVD